MIRRNYIGIFLVCVTLVAMRLAAPNYVLFQDFETPDRTAGGLLNYSNGLVCSTECMQLSTLVARDGIWSIKSQVFAPPTSPCTCGGSIRCETAQLKPDSTESNRFYSFSIFPLNYYSPRDNQNELFCQFKKSYTGASNNPVIALWNVPSGSITKHQLVITVDTVNANQSNPAITIVPLDTLISDKWTDWAFEIRWAANYTGYMKLYRNGVLRYTYNGPTKDKPYDPLHETIPNFRCGIYKFPYCQSPGTINTTQKTMYFDVIKIGNSDMTIADFLFPTVPPATPPTVTNVGGNKVVTLPTSTTTFQTVSSTLSGTIVTKQWTQTSGTSATIASPNSDTTNITGLSTSGTRTFKYKVTNTAGLSDSVIVTVVVNPQPPPANIPPTVNAGNPQTIQIAAGNTTATVNLQGFPTDSDGTITLVTWAKVSGGSATIISPNTTGTTVTGLVAGTYIFSLTATDNNSATGSGTVQITILAAPSVNAGGRLKIRKN